MRGWKNIFHANGNQKKPVVAILISDKTDFKIKNVTRDKEGYYIMIKGQGVNPRRRCNNYKYICTHHRSTCILRQMLTVLKEEIDSNTIIVGDFNTSLTPMDRSSRQKINKETSFK